MVVFHGQEHNYSCAAATLRNALAFSGTILVEDEVCKAAHVNPKAGITNDGLSLAAKHYGCYLDGYVVYNPRYRHTILKWVLLQLKKQPVMILSYNFNHWLLAIGVLNNKIVVVDPWNRRSPPIGLYTTKGLFRIWYNVDPDGVESSQYFACIAKPITKTTRARMKNAAPLSQEALRSLIQQSKCSKASSRLVSLKRLAQD